MSQLKVVKEIDTKELVHRLRSDGMGAIAEVYKLYRNEFIGFSQKYFPNVSRDIFLQAWHDTMVAFYEICLANKYDSKRSSLKTFLFSIGKNQLLKKLKKTDKGNFISIEEASLIKDTNLIIEEREDLSEQASQIKYALGKMGEKCRKLIQLVYYHQYKAEAIQQEMNYDNPNVVYSHKSRCLKKLREIMLESDQS